MTVSQVHIDTSTLDELLSSLIVLSGCSDLSIYDPRFGLEQE